MHYYKRNIGDYAKKTGRLSLLQHGIYSQLIDSCYDRERFPTLEEAIDWLWASGEQELEAINFVLNKFFTLQSDGTYVQSRIQDELQNYQGQCQSNAINGKKGGRPKGTKNKPKITQPVNLKTQPVNLKSEIKPSGSKINPKPLTTNQEPLTTNQEPKVNKYKSLELSKFHDDYIVNIKEFIDHRVNLKKPLTQRALERYMTTVAKTAEELNIAPGLVITETIDAGWQSVKPHWLKNRLGDNHGAHQRPGGGKLSAIDRLHLANDTTDLDRQIAEAEAEEAAGHSLGAPGGDLWPSADQSVRDDDAGDMDMPPDGILIN